ncbi:hypothetical protein EMCRGX_G013360 [Ephydatia muelleri]
MKEGEALDSFGLAPYRFEPTGHGLELSTDDDSDDGDEPPVLPAVRLGNTSWCLCGKCSALATEPECMCCKELPHTRHLFDEEGMSCISEHPEFAAACLQRFPIPNRSYRHAAYRQYILWSYNIRLGRRIRRVIPSCVVTAIRNEFPEPDNNYVGYKEYSGV